MSETHELSVLLSAVATLTDEVASLKAKIGDLEREIGETREIVEAWQAVKTGGRFVKWLAGIGSGLAGMWIFAKAVGSGLLK